VKIDRYHITPTSTPFIIAEVALGHEGSLGMAMAYIDLAKSSGASAVKFQMHLAHEESTPWEPWRVPFSHQDKTRFDYWQRTAFLFEEWQKLKHHAENLGLVFLCSPFSLKACDWLQEMNISAWKVASAEIHNQQLMQRLVESNKPIILSSGLSRTHEVIDLAKDLQAQHHEVALLHCTTRYPTQAEEVGLNVMEEMHSLLPNLPVGLSDHSGEIYPAVVSTYLGASIIEAHLTFHHSMFGPDVKSSLTPDLFKEMVRAVNFAYMMRNNPVNKDAQIEQLSCTRIIFSRSLYTQQSVQAGEILTEKHIGYKKPGGGLTYEQKELIIGRKAKKDLPENHCLRVEDVE
jgi:N-acetylneuraminate synthase